ncbi:hypothetical protein CDD81_4777 [Ophiocordyceps australis]|uniref:FAD-binding FR-type domain-containing protein n=1 Tax=Ophiocordyceps australis TaxID=1399860 RepID=A0A2C5Y9J4_9HYPO|nr:hypothetical protein CDD81_4777 [Ophiocordyceps australis]
MNSLQSRHIQNHSDADGFEKHWGYPDRVVPCKNDAGSCAYLDVVYHSHDLGMLYVGIFWACVGAILLLWACLKHLGRPIESYTDTEADNRGFVNKVQRTLMAIRRRYLLPDALRAVFGHTTRFQVLVLAMLATYMLIFSFVGIVYNTWVTPVKKMPGVSNTRTSLGPFADRVGVLAYALTPLSILLGARESLLSVVTGIPYQSFNFLHRWTGYIIFIQSALHTIGWCVIQFRLYQPQPSVGNEFVKQLYIIWGIVAMILLTILVCLSTPWGIRLTGYEFFRKAHYVLAMVYIGACIGHWDKLQCFLIPALILWGLDRGARFARTAMLHNHPLDGSKLGFAPARASMTLFEDFEHGDLVRLDLENEQDAWLPGQHFFLCFPECSIWQSHPFTPLNSALVREGLVRHSYIMRAKRGETAKLAKLASAKLANSLVDGSTKSSLAPTTSVILTGPYGPDLMDGINGDTNVVCVAGGTGISYVLPILLTLAGRRSVPDRRLELIWTMRHSSDVNWVRQEMDTLARAQKRANLTIRLFATRDLKTIADKRDLKDHAFAEVGSASSSSAPEISECASPARSPTVRRLGEEDGNTEEKHADLHMLVSDFVESTVRGRSVVFASGPGGMLTDLRKTVAELNNPSKVWGRQERFDVDLVCDDRLEW